MMRAIRKLKQDSCLLSLVFPSCVLPLICSRSSLNSGFGDGFFAWIAEAHKNLLCTIRFVLTEKLNGVLEGHDSVIDVLAGTLNAIKKGRDFNQFEARVHEAEVYEIDLLRGLPVVHKER